MSVTNLKATKSKAGPVVEVMDVDPTLASNWLALNRSNRKARERKVEGFARDMREGRWGFDISAIAFDVTGTLINGQHRLGAVIMSDTTQRFIVVTELPTHAQRDMDRGTKRTFGDDLRIEGHTYSALSAAVVRNLVHWQNGTLVSNTSIPTDAELAAFFEANTDKVRAASEVGQHVKSLTSFPPGPVGAVFFRCHEISPNQALEFFTGLASGAGLDAKSPVLALRNRLTRARTNGERLNTAEVMALITTAWNAYRNGETRTRTQIARGGLTGARMPKPI